LSTSIIKRIVGVIAAFALALGIGAATAVPANAASTVWDRVAACESGNRWQINTGNGYYGGLQFSSSTWRAFGGRTYASQANRASKAQQIAIARRVLASQGPGAWPVCSKRAGLTKSNGKASRTAKSSTSRGSSATISTRSTKSVSVKKSSSKKATTSSKSSGRAKYIKVRRGDTLGKLARRYHVKGGWRGMWKLNKSRLKNPNWIRVGQSLRVR
jgi:resuscitation-promoting factor RpfA